MNKEIKKIIDVLKAGKIIIFPTDTVCVVGCDATNKKAVEKIFKIKKRDFSNPLPIFANIDVINKFCFIPDRVKPILDKFWPGELTAKFEYTNDFKINQNTLMDNKLAIRIPNNSFILELINNIDFPIIATSANLSGETPPSLLKDIKINADLIIRNGSKFSGKPSTIVDFTQEPFKVIREGNITEKDLLKCLKKQS